MRWWSGWRSWASSLRRKGGGRDAASGPTQWVPDKEEGAMKFLSQTFMIRTEKGPQFIDITERIEEVARQSGVSNGFAVVFSKHTTAAIRINENEPGLLSDMERMLEEIAPSRALSPGTTSSLTPSPTTGSGPTGTPTASTSCSAPAKPFP